MAALPLSCQQEMLFLTVPIQPTCREQIDPEEQMGAQISDNFPALLVTRTQIIVGSHQDHQVSNSA